MNHKLIEKTLFRTEAGLSIEQLYQIGYKLTTVNQLFKKNVHADMDVLYITEFEHFHCQVQREKKKKLIRKLEVWVEDCSLNVGSSGRCVAAWVHVCDDESENEPKRLK